MKKLVLGATVLLAMLAAACGGDDDSASSATSTATASSATATATAPAAATKQFASEHFAVPVSMTADSSWTVDYDVAGWFALKHAGDTTYPSGLLEVFQPTAVHAYDGLSTAAVPADLVAWLEANPALVEQKKSEVTVGGLAGTELEIGSNTGSGFPLFDMSADSFEVNYTDRIRFYVLVGPTGPIVMAAHAQPASVFDRLLPLVDPIVASMQFSRQ